MAVIMDNNVYFLRIHVNKLSKQTWGKEYLPNKQTFRLKK